MLTPKQIHDYNIKGYAEIKFETEEEAKLFMEKVRAFCIFLDFFTTLMKYDEPFLYLDPEDSQPTGTPHVRKRKRAMQ